MKREAILKVILSLSYSEHGRIPVGNEAIYREISGLSRFSRKKFMRIGEILKTISPIEIYVLGGVNYQFNTWRPMCRTRYCFINKANQVIAGFSVIRK